MTVFTLADVLAVAKTLPQDMKNPTFDGGCRYAPPDNLNVPSCLVGTITFKLDRALFDLIADDNSTVKGLDSDWRDRFTSEAIAVLDHAQSQADHKWDAIEDPDQYAEVVTWGEAIEAALFGLGHA